MKFFAVRYRKLTDQELWEYCRKDDMEAYDQLFERYTTALYKVAYKALRDSVVAEELAMDVMFNLWQMRHRAPQINDLGGYLYRSVRNLVIDHHRKKNHVYSSVDSIQEQFLTTGTAADHDLLSREAHAFYQQQLAELSPQRLKVYKMSREENKSHAEIAQETNLSINTVDRHITTTLDILRKSLKKYSSTSLLTLWLFFQ